MRPRRRLSEGATAHDWYGWKNVIDLGDITSARGAEMYLPLCLLLWGALQAPAFNIKVVGGHGAFGSLPRQESFSDSSTHLSSRSEMSRSILRSRPWTSSKAV